MNENTAVIEVKGKIDKDGIIKDFETLTTFTSKYQYQFGFFILYNKDISSVNDILNELIAKYGTNLSIIDIITIQNAHSECQIHEYIDKNYVLVTLPQQ